MPKKSEYIRCITPPFRVSYPYLTEARPGPNGEEAKYSVKMLFPKNAPPAELEALKAIRDTCGKAAKAYWPDKLPINLKKPFRDGDTESDNPEDKGFWIATARTKQRPGVVDARNVEHSDPAAISKLIYGGCWARASVLVGATDTAGNKCVHLLLGNIQKLRDDTAFGGRKAATEDFDALETTSAEKDFDIDF